MEKIINFINNVPLYNTYENHILFKHVGEREQYFSSFDKNKQLKVNFPYGNFLNTDFDITIPYRNEDAQDIGIFAPNYAIVSDINHIDQYYFVTDIVMKSVNTAHVYLELDVITTFIPNNAYTFRGKLPIERKMCNRFIENSRGDTLFDFSYARVLEGNNNPNKTKLYKPTPHFAVDKNANETLKNATWTYFFYTLDNVSAVDNFSVKYNNVDSGVYCIAVPNFNYWIKKETSYYIGASSKELYDELKDGNKQIKIVNIISSPYPFWNDQRGDIAYGGQEHNGIVIPTRDDIAFKQIGLKPLSCMQVKKFDTKITTFDNFLLPNNRNIDTISYFGQEKIVKNLQLEPKLFNFDNHFIRILDREGNYFDYDETLLDNPNRYYNLNSIHNVTMENDASFYFIGNNDSKFESNYKHPIETLTGLISKTIDGQNVLSNAFTDYVQQHKNFLLSGLLAQPTQLGIGSIMGRKYEKMDTAPVVKEVLGYDIYKKGGIGLKSNALMGFNIGQSLNNAIKISDIMLTPSNVNNSKGNYYDKLIFNNRLLPYVLYYDLTDEQKKNVYDTYFKFGYLVNSDFTWEECNQRKGFNFIKTSESIKSLIRIGGDYLDGLVLPNIVIDKIDEIFQRGIRLWKLNANGKVYNDFDFDYENWEESIPYEN